MAQRPSQQRFLSRVTLPDSTGCMLWLGSLNHNGYGQFSHGYRNVRAHRFAYEMWMGPIPEGMQLDHLCRVRACVRPDHLEPVTPRENTLRGTSPAAIGAAKTHCPKGHPLSEGNLRRRPNARGCLTCHRDRQRTYRARIKGAA